MYISSIQIENYKSFRKSEVIELSEGFNVIVGANNVGKTALLECLTLRIAQEEPHSTLVTKEYEFIGIPREPTLHISFKITKDDFYRVAQTIYKNYERKVELYIIIPKNMNGKAVGNNYNASYKTNTLPSVKAVIRTGGQIKSVAFDYIDLESSLESPEAFLFQVQKDELVSILPTLIDTKKNEQRNMEATLLQYLQEDVFMFHAERLTISKSESNTGYYLKPDASNLPEVLFNLRLHRYAMYEKYLQTVQEIFPEITDVIPRNIAKGVAEIRILTTPRALNRDDLEQPLSKCGTGLGQVLAMLYVLCTSEWSRTILIDEPNSFLHPGAVHKLFELFKDNQVKHQIIVSTHSPTVIAAADPEKILLVEKQDSESKTRVIDRTEREQMESVLKSIGSRLPEVFGVQDILWVEGDTEEKCLLKIIRSLCRNKLSRGTVAKGVKYTSDFEAISKDKDLTKDKVRLQRIIHIHKKLSENIVLIPPAVGFIFDRETKDDVQREDLKREGVYVINYRMFENYLLNYQAIANVLKSMPDAKSNISVEQIQAWIKDNIRAEDEKRKLKYFPDIPKNHVPLNANISDINTLKILHGASLLRDLFDAFKREGEDGEDGSLVYEKKAYGEALTNWLLQNNKEHLYKLRDELDSYFDQLQQKA